jgi:nitrogen regulatory protein P-II 1
MLPKIQMNIVLSDRNLEATIEAILRAAYTGEQGDGLIFVYPVEEVIRIRTRERSQEAMTYPGDIDERKAGVHPPAPRESSPESSPGT